MYLLTVNYSAGLAYSTTFSTFYSYFASAYSGFFAFFAFFFFLSPYYLVAPFSAFNSLRSASSYSLSCCFFDFFTFFWLDSTSAADCSGSGCSVGTACSYSSDSLSEDSSLPKANGFLTVSR
jgi:hypothetical protein